MNRSSGGSSLSSVSDALDGMSTPDGISLSSGNDTSDDSFQVPYEAADDLDSTHLYMNRDSKDSSNAYVNKDEILQIASVANTAKTIASGNPDAARTLDEGDPTFVQKRTTPRATSDSNRPSDKTPNLTKPELSPTIEDIQKLLTCFGCNKTYNQPKLLVCLHSFCTSCIQTYRESNVDYVICSLCRTCQPIPENGIAGLTRSFTFDELLDTTSIVHSPPKKCQACEKNERPEFICTTCNVAICKPCQVGHANLKVTKHHTVLPLGVASSMPLSIYAGCRQVLCKEHDEVIQFLCVPCGLFVCSTEAKNAHTNHEIEPISDIRIRFKRNASELERKVRQSILASKHSEARAESRKDKLNEKFRRIEENIDTAVKDTERYLRLAASDLKEDLRQHRIREEDNLDDVVKEARCSQDSSHHLRRMLLSITKESNDIDALTFVSYCEQSYSAFREKGSSSTAESNIQFVPSSQLYQLQANLCLGRIRDIETYPAFIIPEVEASFEILDAVTGMAVNIYGEIVCTSFHSRRCVMYDSSGRVIRDISSSVVRPWDVAFNYNNSFVVTDCGDTAGHGSLKMFSPAGSFVKIIAANITSPAGVTVDRSGRIYVCEENECSVKVFSIEGQLLTTLKVWKEQFIFTGPIYVAINVNNDVVVCDDHRRIHILSPVGATLGKYAVDSHHDLMSLCTDDGGQMLVVDNQKKGLHVLTVEGKLRRFVSLADNKELRYINCVSVAPSGRLLVAGGSRLVVLKMFV